MSTLFSDLKSNNGALTLSSLSRVDFSMEGDQLKNGLTTYCSINGLRDQKGDLDKDDHIRLSKLLNYLTNQGHFIYQLRHRPNLRQSNL